MPRYWRFLHHPAASQTNAGQLLHDLILGGQDGLVNILGLILGVATATGDPRVVLVAGLAGTFAESISMGAVAYTSSKAQQEFMHEKSSSTYAGSPAREGAIVLVSSLAGSLIPLLPFILGASLRSGVIVAVVLSVVSLGAGGLIKARIVHKSPIGGAVELIAIGMLAALAGFIIGKLFGAVV